jgi:hypothetical protein
MIVAVVIGLALIAGLAVWGRHQRPPQPVTPSPSPAPVRGLQRVGVIPDGLPPRYTSYTVFADDRAYEIRDGSGPDQRTTTVTAIDLTTGRKLWTAGPFAFNLLAENIVSWAGSRRIPFDVASDGRFLVVTTAQEITVYRLTQ